MVECLFYTQYVKVRFLLSLLPPTRSKRKKKTQSKHKAREGYKAKFIVRIAKFIARIAQLVERNTEDVHV